jgi:hypothetical protein
MSLRIDTNLPLLCGAIRRFRLQEVAGSGPASSIIGTCWKSLSYVPCIRRAASAFSSAPSSRASAVSHSQTKVTITADSDPQVLL